MGAPPLGHETWFVEDRFDADWSFAGEGLTIALLAAAVVAALAVRVAARVWPGMDVPFLAGMVRFMPFAVRIHLAVSLVSLLSLGFYLSPAMDLQADLAGILLGTVMALAAVGMAAGWHAPIAGWLLVAAGPLGMLEFGFWPVVQRIDLLGLAAFVIVSGAGPWSADFEAGRTSKPSPLRMAQGLWALRVAAGVALIVVAFAEKLAEPELGLALLDQKPDLNVAAQLGLPMGDLEFVRLAGAIEVLFGLLLISGALPQLVVLAAGIPFNATLWFFGNTELVGHLPTYGTMLALLVLGSHPEIRPLVSAAWPFGDRRERA